MTSQVSLAEIVAKGGCYWVCRKCPGCGVITADSPLAKAARSNQGVPTPEPCTVTFVRCSEHSSNEELQCVSD